ncbi:MAG TPA: hypothetical protein DD490_26045 [Acidobacteria bacterium]|nr:hypothetical protein [Acidobacteriota bacterium]
MEDLSHDDAHRRPLPDLRLFGLMGEAAKLPVTLFVSSAQVMLQAALRLQAIFDQSVDVVTKGVALASVEPASAPVPPVPEPGAAAGTVPAGSTGTASQPVTMSENPGAQHTAAAVNLPREAIMSDTNLNDDMVKLVRYTILTIQRDDEHVLGDPRNGQKNLTMARGEKVVTDSMSEEAFSNWVITDYLRQPGREDIKDDEERKYLRVCYEVLGRWAKQDRKYEKRQLETLQGIQNVLGELVKDKTVGK